MSTTKHQKSGEPTMQTQETRANANAGNKPKTDAAEANKPKTDAEASAAPASADAKPAEKKGGKPPAMPHVAVYHLNGRVYAGVYNPADKTSYVESGKGEGSAVGALVDSGFKLTDLTPDGPAWIKEFIPPGAEKVQYAGIRSFPLPKQS